MQTIARYTPQQNGVAERKNQTIMNMARTLLKEKSLSITFWVEAVACSVYLLNRSPTTSLKMKVPQEAWSGTKLNVAHLRTFRCIAYDHIPSDPGGYRWPPTFSDWVKTIFWQFWQFTIFSRF
jgi:hypothetical protein